MEEIKNDEQKLSTEEVKLAISEVISETKENHEKIRLASKSGELKRNPFVNLDEKGILTPDNIVREWDAIQARKSSLSSNQRQCVQQIVYLALRKAAIKRAKATDTNEQPKTDPTPTTKPKRSRKKKPEQSASEK